MPVAEPIIVARDLRKSYGSLPAVQVGMMLRAVAGRLKLRR